LKEVQFQWPEKILKLEYISKKKDDPNFSVDVNGKAEGILIFNGIKYSIKCDWIYE
jgi:hypothetical protein